MERLEMRIPIVLETGSLSSHLGTCLLPAEMFSIIHSRKSCTYILVLVHMVMRPGGFYSD